MIGHAGVWVTPFHILARIAAGARRLPLDWFKHRESEKTKKAVCIRETGLYALEKFAYF
jgi:hypothetical protein